MTVAASYEATAAGTHAMLEAIETGLRVHPEHLRRVADVLGLDMPSLLGGR